MAHIKKYWLVYLLLLVILILVAYQLKWFGNKKTLFCGGGIITGQAANGGRINPHIGKKVTRKGNCADGYEQVWTHGSGVLGWLGWTGSWSLCQPA